MLTPQQLRDISDASNKECKERCERELPQIFSKINRYLEVRAKMGEHILHIQLRDVASSEIIDRNLPLLFKAIKDEAKKIAAQFNIAQIRWEGKEMFLVDGIWIDFCTP